MAGIKEGEGNELISIQRSLYETLEKLYSVLTEAYPGIQIARMYSPPFRPMTEDEDMAIVEQINETEPYIVRGIPEFRTLGCLRLIHLKRETYCMVSLCVHVRFLETLSYTLTEVDTIRHYQPIRNNAAPERN